MELENHLKTTEDRRDRNWDEKFFRLISDSNLSLLSLDPQQGPDGWPYLMTETASNDSQNSSANIDSFQKVAFWLSEKGIGLVVNPRRMPYPDFVFSYGMIWSFRETGYFIRYDMNRNQDSKLNIDDPKQMKIGSPTEAYLPKYVRRILKNFFIDQGVLNPKVLMLAADGENYDLCFSLESIGHPPEQEHSGILEALSWFLPPHYSLALISEKNFPTFEAL